MSEVESFRVGQRVTDTYQDDKPEAIVVATHDIPAKIFGIPALDGKTVAACNPPKWSEDPVIKVIYMKNADYRLDEWSTEWLVEAFQDGRIKGIGGLRAYSLPSGRLEPSREHEETQTAGKAEA